MKTGDLLLGRTFGHVTRPEFEIESAEDYELTQAASGGDMAAFEELYSRHSRRVYSLCLRMTANTAEAEDLAQEVFIQLYRKAGSFRGESAFTTWLHRLTVNQVLMHFRKSKTRKDQAPLADVPQAALGTSVQHGGPVQMIERVALDLAIAQLPPGYRAVFLLHDAMGYEHEEIARLLGCAVGTSKSQLHKARMKLRRIIRGR
ncbi:MAG: polymerase sigma-70 factor, subfamily, partial [Gaiellaceae bacterium]|nr:polymerase sigma-70 factor, subfamily [Gaiellaceae bacterium]